MMYKISYSVEFVNDEGKIIESFGYDSGESLLDFKDAVTELSTALFRTTNQPDEFDPALLSCEEDSSYLKK